MRKPRQETIRPRIGLHTGIAGGLHNALLKAQALGADTVQIFSRNPRGWQARPLVPEEVEQFKRVRAETGVSPVVIHANYLINLAAADEGHTREVDRLLPRGGRARPHARRRLSRPPPRQRPRRLRRGRHPHLRGEFAGRV